MPLVEPSKSDQNRALWLSASAFTACFAVWTIFSIIGVQIKEELNLNETQFGLLLGTPILTGSLIRLVLGIWTDQIGGRLVFFLVMIAGALSTYLLTFAHDYNTFLLAALGLGISGGSFAVGIPYVSKWFPQKKQGFALGIFGAGNVGAAVTKFAAPVVMVALGWKSVAIIWAISLGVMAIIFLLCTKDEPDLAARRSIGKKSDSFGQMLEPLKNIQVWRFSLYYFFVFGGFVALAMWLPRYLKGAYNLDIVTAGILAAAFSVPGSLFRVLGGSLSDTWGARKVLYITFLGSIAATFFLSYPSTHYVVSTMKGPLEFTASMGLIPFIVLIFALGFFMSLGKAAVFKHIPAYYPNRVGAVGGVVGLMGGLGGFVLPIVFGVLNDWMGIWTSCFMLLFAIAVASFVWMHLAVLKMEREKVSIASPIDELPK